MGTEEAVYQWRTMSRLVDYIVFDAGLVDDIVIQNENCRLKVSKSVLQTRVVRSSAGIAAAPIPMRSEDVVPRRLYVMPGDHEKHGFTQGCPGCTFAQAGIGTTRGHSEACRNRMEYEIGKDATDKQAEKVREDHYIAQKFKNATKSSVGGSAEKAWRTR